MSRILVLLGCTSLVLAAAACGSEGDQSTFVDPTAAGASESASKPSDPIGQGGNGTPISNDPNAKCAEASAEAKLTPVNLVIAYDRSGSMGDTQEDPSFDPAQRWAPVGEAMKAFFADPTSVGLNATLTFFPKATNSCDANDYATADVPLAALPNAAFVAAIDATAPKGDTPTRAATLGAIAQANAIAAQHPNEKTVVVLVTDGEPYGCGIETTPQSNTEAAGVAAEVAKVKAQTPTYVIGVGPSVSNLDAVAASGGTSAFHVQVGSAQQTTSQLALALSAIKGAVARCDFDIPPPPDGRTIDFAKVDVQKLNAAGAETLTYAADCANGAGWHFDDPQKPSKVLLCSAACDAIKKETSGKVNVSFRCTDRPDAVK
jgi:hypothetical protein